VLAADTLFTAHHDRVFRYLARMIGRGDAARDLTQEVFLRVTRAGVPAVPADEQRAWLFHIARNIALNHLRDGRRTEPATVEVSGAVPATQELAIALDRALASLADLDRDAFLLRESGLSYAEIAGACGLTVEAVRGRLFRAREQLRSALGHWVLIEEQRGLQLSRKR
jgi:RNA polymerase sigma-70 factor, ECF subfamily